MRQKRSRLHRGTQTETPTRSLNGSPQHLARTDSQGSTGGPDGEFYEEQAALYDRLLKAEEVRLVATPTGLRQHPPLVAKNGVR